MGKHDFSARRKLQSVGLSKLILCVKFDTCVDEDKKKYCNFIYKCNCYSGIVGIQQQICLRIASQQTQTTSDCCV